MDSWPLRAEMIITEEATGKIVRYRACAACHKAIEWKANDRWPCDLCGGSFHDQCCGGGLDECDLCGATVCEFCGGTEEFIIMSGPLADLHEKDLCLPCRRAAFAWARAKTLRRAVRTYA